MLLLFVRQLLDLGLDEYLDALAVVADAASREHRIDVLLAEMVAEWDQCMLSFKPYKLTGMSSLTGACVLAVVCQVSSTASCGAAGASADDTKALIEAHLLKTRTMIGVLRDCD
jgi:hypothetical protein